MQLKKRGRIWWTYITNPNGGRREFVTTGCQDKKAAEAVAADLERRAVDPAYRAAHEETIAVATERYLSECKAQKLSEKTIVFYTQRMRHILRLFLDIPLVKITRDAVIQYGNTRQEEGASEHSIWKELQTFKSSVQSCHCCQTIQHTNH